MIFEDLELKQDAMMKIVSWNPDRLELTLKSEDNELYDFEIREIGDPFEFHKFYKEYAMDQQIVKIDIRDDTFRTTDEMWWRIAKYVGDRKLFDFMEELVAI